MRHVLLADTLKSSLVMTSEIFKDRVKDCAIHIVGTGEECVQFLKERTPDMIVVDFDLPDTDGVMLSKYLRKHYQGPVIITAYPHRIVDEAIEKELFPYNDSCHWIKKPVRMEEFGDVIDHFLIGNRRIEKRFLSEYDVHLTGKSAGRGKRTPKVDGTTLDVSLGGCKVHSKNAISLAEGDEITAVLSIPNLDISKQKISRKSSRNSENIETISLKFKAHIAWKNQTQKIVGVCFQKMSENQKSILEDLIKDQKVLPDHLESFDLCGS